MAERRSNAAEVERVASLLRERERRCERVAPTREASELPVGSLREALPWLRRPFTPGAVGFKVQKIWMENGGAALIVGYVDARLVAERLNMVVGERWSDEYKDVPGRPGAKTCLLTVGGVTRQDVGEASGLALEKALRSDAFKRAAVKFGVGVSVYAMPRLMFLPSDGLRAIKVYNPRTNRRDKDSFALTEAGQALARRRYEDWLKETGLQAFGDPLDHGDTEDSQGDWEAEDGGDAGSVLLPVGEDIVGPGGVPPVERPEWRVALDGFAATELSSDQRREIGACLSELDEQTVSMLCIAAGVEKPEELTQATVPAFMEAYGAYAAGAGTRG